MSQITLDGLSPAQVQVASVLATGSSISKAAALTGAGRTTIYTWIKTVPKFAALVQTLTRDCSQILRDKLHDLSAEAIDTVGAMMSGEKAPASVRLRAALAILNRPTFPDKGWVLPFPEDLEAGNHASVIQQEMPEPSLDAEVEAAPQPQTAQPAQSTAQNGTKRNNSEQKTQNFPPGIPRSAPCPCGSGQKYKRCCGRSAPPVLSTAA